MCMARASDRFYSRAHYRETMAHVRGRRRKTMATQGRSLGGNSGHIRWNFWRRAMCPRLCFAQGGGAGNKCVGLLGSPPNPVG
jgi:hypothetical protein